MKNPGTVDIPVYIARNRNACCNDYKDDKINSKTKMLNTHPKPLANSLLVPFAFFLK